MPDIIHITSKANDTIKWLTSLSQSKYRDRYTTFLAHGHKLSEDALRLKLPVTHLLLRQDAADSFIAEHRRVLSPDLTVLVLSEACFAKVSSENSPDGVIVAVKYLDNFNNYYIINKDTFFPDAMGPTVFLDSVRDPGNLGAVLRSAAAFGVTDIVMSADCADVYHPRTLRASMGGIYSLRLHTVGDMEGAVRLFRERGRRVLAAELRESSVDYRQSGLCSGDAVVIGNEGHGISPLVSAACDGSIFIPISDRVESLNAAVAGSLLIFLMMQG